MLRVAMEVTRVADTNFDCHAQLCLRVQSCHPQEGAKPFPTDDGEPALLEFDRGVWPVLRENM